MTLKVLSPCKVNLFLHINGQRADGYHELQTVFQLLDHGDTLHFSTGNKGEIDITPTFPDIPVEENLHIYAELHITQQNR